MKRFLPLAWTLLFLFSCRTLSYFESPNSLRNVDGIVYLQNGKSFEGKINIQVENIFGSPVKVFSEGETKPMQFNLEDVKGYEVKGRYYELKEIRESINLGKRLVFMRRLTPQPSGMHLYEYMKKETVNKTATRHESEYYIQLPKEENNHVYASGSAKFVPHFEEKVSKLLSDCPTLSQKIATRQHGYFYAQVNLLKERKLDVLLRIIDEYNQCEKRSKQ